MKNINVIDLFENKFNFELVDVSVINEIMENYEFGEVYSIDEFDFEGCDVKLVKGESYRGVGCYEGLVEKNGKKYFIDVMNGEIENIVFERD